MQKPLSPLHGVLSPFLAWLVFAGLFFGATRIFPPDVADISSSSILAVFEKYASYAGLVIGFLALFDMLILMGLRALFRIKKSRFVMPIILTIAFLPWLIFGYQLVFVEPRYANLAKAIISFLGEPMLYASAVMVGVGLLWLLATPFIRPK